MLGRGELKDGLMDQVGALWIVVQRVGDRVTSRGGRESALTDHGAMEADVTT
jgi:hypothetical protein